MHLFDQAEEIGGQFNIAKQIPGKEEFFETMRYFKNRMALAGVNIHLNQRVEAQTLIDSDFDEVILATGIKPRTPAIEGVEHEKVMTYLDVLKHKKPVGKKVAVIGAGGIGFDVSEYLVEKHSLTMEPEKWLKNWGIDKSFTNPGALIPCEVEAPEREVYLLQRKASKVGKNLGKTTGWIHRAALKQKRVQMINNVSYDKIDDAGLHISIGDDKKVLDVDNIIICAGQEPLRELQSAIESAGKAVHLIGGADVAAELDAKRAIKQGAELAAAI